MDSLIDLIMQLKSKCIKNELQTMDETDLSPAEYNAISTLERGEKVCGGDLSRKMSLSPSRASRVIDKLVRNGYLDRKNDSLDRRRCTISLAEKGIRVKRKIEKIKKDCESKVTAALTDLEKEYLTRSLKKINEVL